MSKKEKKEKKDSEQEIDLEEIDDEASVVLQEEKEENLLIPRDEYLASGVHIGTKLKTKHSEKWIYRTTSYGLYVLNLLETDRRIRIAGKFLASFEPERIMVCSVRRYGRNPVKKFCEITGAKAFAERFIPGTLTNPLIDQFHEADVLLMIDPHADKQALAEAKLARIPVVSFIDTDDYLYDIDLAIPANNRGRKSLSRMLWLLARQIMRERGKIPPDGDIDLTLNDFESKISKPEVESS
ncbi:MAG: 30S ribosomal protein S2 [Promethearchaeota archaeon]